MNRFLKPLLILLGLALVGYAIYFKTLALDSPKSVWENNLTNAARRSDADLLNEFNRIMDHVESGWPVVIFAGFAVVITSCFIKTLPKDRPPEA
jgi:hypothetical protein